MFKVLHEVSSVGCPVAVTMHLYSRRTDFVCALEAGMVNSVGCVVNPHTPCRDLSAASVHEPSQAGGLKSTGSGLSLKPHSQLLRVLVAPSCLWPPLLARLSPPRPSQEFPPTVTSHVLRQTASLFPVLTLSCPPRSGPQAP